MPLAARVLSVAFVACTWIAAASAQAVRVPHTGRVLDADKKPVAGAKVTLVSAGARGGLDEGDVVRVDADADGRFRAQLQATRAYVAWATTTWDGGFSVCAPVDVGSLPIELVVAPSPMPAFGLTGVEAWREHGELRVEISLFDCAELTLSATPDDKGKLALPPLPAVPADLFVFVGDRLVHATNTHLAGPTSLPKPHRLAVRVADDKGQPVAKARIERVVWTWASSSGPFNSRPKAKSFPVATTGDDGTAVVLLAADKDPFQNESGWSNLLFRARHDGHAPGLSGFTKKAFVNGKLVEDKEPAVLPFALAAPNAVPIKVLAPEGQMPAAIQRIGYRSVPYEKNSTTSVVDGDLSPVRDGVVRFEKKDDDYPWTIETPPVSPPLPAGDPWQRSVRPLPLVVPESALQGELDLRTVLPLRVQVLDRGAGPAIGARILCAAASGGSFLDPAFAMHARADRSGRAVLPVLPGNWFVMAVHDDGIAHATVEAAPGLAPQSLQLRAFDRMRVRVVDGEGKPVQGARFSSNGSSWSGGGTPEDEMLRQAGWQVSQWSLQRCESDAEGRADLLFLAAKGMQMRLEVRKEKRRARVQNLEVSDDPMEIVLK